MFNRFPIAVTVFTVISFITIYILDLNGVASNRTEPYIRFSLAGFFVIAHITLIIKEFKNELRNFDTLFKDGFIVALALPMLLTAAILNKKVGIIMTGFFIGIALLYFIFNRKVYSDNYVFKFLAGYAIFLCIGTIGSSKGFHFPEITYTFYLLPAAFLLFNLSQDTLLRVGKIFVRTITVYLAFSLIYWWFNFQYLDSDMLAWLSRKVYYLDADMLFWEEQTRWLRGTPKSHAFFFVNSWSHYFHPSYIAIVLFMALITSFYLRYKQHKKAAISKTELFIINLLAFVMLILMQSRIGIVGFIFTLGITGLYYSKLKLHMFKVTLIIYIIIGTGTMIVMDDKIDTFLSDSVRKTDYTLAISYIKDHFWWGTGMLEQHIALENQEQLLQETLPPTGFMKTYTHNQFLGNMVQFGIWGLLALIILLWGITRYAIKERSFLLQLFMGVFLLFMLIEEPLYTQEGVTRFTIFLVYFVAISESKKKRKVYDISKAVRTGKRDRA